MTHYSRWHRTGSTELRPREPWSPTIDRFIVNDAGCHVWQGAINPRWGYGQVWAGGRVQRAHRVAYEIAHGPVPEGLDLDHLCRNRACINPDHLEPVTRAENMRRAWAASRG